MEKADPPVDLHFFATDFGVERKPANPRILEDARKLAAQIRRELLAESVRD